MTTILRKSFLFSLLLLIALQSSCAVLKVGLTQALIDKYIQTYSSLSKAGFRVQKEELIKDSKEAFEKAEIIIKKNGFKNYVHFLRVHTKIMKGIIILESERQLDRLVQKYAPDMGDWHKRLYDPHVPDDQKKEIRKKLAQLIKDYQENEEYNDPLKILSRFVISQEALMLIRENETQLRAVITPTDIQHTRKQEFIQ